MKYKLSIKERVYWFIKGSYENKCFIKYVVIPLDLVGYGKFDLLTGELV